MKHFTLSALTILLVTINIYVTGIYYNGQISETNTCTNSMVDGVMKSLICSFLYHPGNQFGSSITLSFISENLPKGNSYDSSVKRRYSAKKKGGKHHVVSGKKDQNQAVRSNIRETDLFETTDKRMKYIVSAINTTKSILSNSGELKSMVNVFSSENTTIGDSISHQRMNENITQKGIQKRRSVKPSINISETLSPHLIPTKTRIIHSIGRTESSNLRSRVSQLIMNNAQSLVGNLLNISSILSYYIPMKNNLDVLHLNNSTITSNISISAIFNANRASLINECRDSHLYAFCQRNYMIRWNSNDGLFRTYAPTPLITSSFHFNVSYVTHLSVDRLQYMKKILSRWQGPISLAIISTIKELPQIDAFITKFKNRSNLRIVVYVASFNSKSLSDNYIIQSVNNKNQNVHLSSRIYPINLLRDLAIMNIETTHYLNMDMDLWPSNSLYSSFDRIDMAIKVDDKAAIILPAFQFVKSLRFGSEKSMKNLRNFIPVDKSGLLAMMTAKRVTIANSHQTKHKYIGKYWLISGNETIQQIPCMNYSSMEPYVLLKRSEITPLFHPYYVNYGFDKVEFIQHLRFEGYKFYIFMNNFGFDIPHVASPHNFNFMKFGSVEYTSIRQLHKRIMKLMSNDNSTFPLCIH